MDTEQIVSESQNNESEVWTNGRMRGIERDAQKQNTTMINALRKDKTV